MYSLHEIGRSDRISARVFSVLGIYYDEVSENGGIYMDLFFWNCKNVMKVWMIIYGKHCKKKQNPFNDLFQKHHYIFSISLTISEDEPTLQAGILFRLFAHVSFWSASALKRTWLRAY